MSSDHLQSRNKYSISMCNTRQLTIADFDPVCNALFVSTGLWLMSVNSTTWQVTENNSLCHRLQACICILTILHRWPQSVPILYNGLHPPLKIAHSHGRCGPPSKKHGSLGLPVCSTQTASLSLQPFLQGSLAWQTNRPPDYTTQLVTIGRIYIRSTGYAA